MASNQRDCEDCTCAGNLCDEPRDGPTDLEPGIYSFAADLSEFATPKAVPCSALSENLVPGIGAKLDDLPLTGTETCSKTTMQRRHCQCRKLSLGGSLGP